jgi:hypothetical protein
MKNLVDTILTAPLKDFLQRIIGFLPNLLSSLIILIIGFVVGWILKIVITRILTILKIDHFCGKVGITQGFEKIGMKETPTGIIGRFIYWLVVITFIIIAFYTLKVPAVEDLLEKFFLYLPNVFVAALLITIGYIVANFLGRATIIASVNAGILFSGLLANGVKAIIFLISFTMALEQLGIGRDTVIVAFTIVFGGIVFALALAFGLGGRDMAKEYLEKRLKRKSEEKEDEFTHI